MRELLRRCGFRCEGEVQPGEEAWKRDERGTATATDLGSWVTVIIAHDRVEVRAQDGQDHRTEVVHGAHAGTLQAMLDRAVVDSEAMRYQQHPLRGERPTRAVVVS